MALAATGLTNGNRRTRRLFDALVPLSLVAVLYDTMRLTRNTGLSPPKVHIADIRAKELKWFGIGSGASRMTLQDWFQEHACLPLDLFCAVPYGVFLYVVTGYAVYLVGRDRDSQRRFAWGFFVLNVAGFVTYHLYPAAPPWYFRMHGARIHLDEPPNEGTHLARVDALLGYPYFKKMYARGSDVFGAVPSLHVAYPLLMILEGWKLHGPVGRSLLALFYGSMCFSAVYLDHHWVIDVILGSGYAVGTSWLMRRLIPPTREENRQDRQGARDARILSWASAPETKPPQLKTGSDRSEYISNIFAPERGMATRRRASKRG
jgi:membrane-associated phospholipid phosphatase